MLVEMRSKTQMTIPMEMVKKSSFPEGDKLEVFEKDGMICMMPVVVYPGLRGETEEGSRNSESQDKSWRTADILFCG